MRSNKRRQRRGGKAGKPAEIAGSDERATDATEAGASAGSDGATSAGIAGETVIMVQPGVSNVNTVDVDPAALTAEAERAIADASDLAGDGAAVDGQQEGELQQLAQSWRPLVQALTPTLRITLLPQWNITPELQTEFMDSLSASLDLLFPGGLDGKYAPFARLLAVSAGIVVVNYTANGGKLPPLGPKKADDTKPAAATASA
jgi:hypothetical protein